MFDARLEVLQAGFFDTEAVRRAADAVTRAALSRFGAFTRQRARSSIRKRKKVSAPGQPPSSHEGSLKRLILFAYDATRKSVVVGPVKFARGEAPRLLEHGGTTVRGGTSGPRTLTYRARPFVGPAARTELDKFPETLSRFVK